MINHVITGDSFEILKSIKDNSIDSVVSDPPYGIKFLRKAWDYDVVPVELWTEVLRVLKPGGYIAIACGTRTYHRMAVNVEDAGFEIRDAIAYAFESNRNLNNFYESLNDEQKKAFLQIMDDNMHTGTAVWAYASGFPKNTDIALAIDKHLGAKSNVTGVKYHRSKDNTYGNGNGLGSQPVSFKKEPVTEQAKQWQGFGTALKPAVELWLIARKPLSEKNIASNVLTWGTGALNISACKIETASLDDTDGRYPANLIHDGSKEVLDIFKKAGYRKSKKHDGDGALLDTKGTGWGFRRLPGGFSDEGTPERFFYCAKASTKERNLGLHAHLKNNHPTVKPLSLIRYLVKLITPPNGIVLDPFAGSGTTGIACVLDGFKFICIEKEESYADIARKRINYFKHNNVC